MKTKPFLPAEVKLNVFNVRLDHNTLEAVKAQGGSKWVRKLILEALSKK